MLLSNQILNVWTIAGDTFMSTKGFSQLKSALEATFFQLRLFGCSLVVVIVAVIWKIGGIVCTM